MPGESQGATVSTRIRILSLIVLTGLTALAPVAFGAPGQVRDGENANDQFRAAEPIVGRSGDTREARSWRFGSEPLAPSARPRSVLSLRGPLSTSFDSIDLGAPPEAPVGAFPVGIAVSSATDTVYVVNANDDSVSVIDAHHCNAGGLSGCGNPVATIPLGAQGVTNTPASVVVSPDGGTLYVTAPGGADDVAVINARTCNATDTSTCANGPIATVAAGPYPAALAEDPDNGTLYVANIDSDTVSVINAALCNAQHTAGCTTPAAQMTVGNGPGAVAINPRTNSVYVANIGDDTVSVINAAFCDATHPAGCATDPPLQAVGAAPGSIAISELTDTVYVVNSGLENSGAIVPGGNTVSILDGAACNGEHPGGCSAVPPPVVAVGGLPGGQPEAVAIDPRTQDVYTPEDDDDTMSIIDGWTCNARHLSGCPRTAAATQTGAGPGAVGVLPSLRTVYVADGDENAVSIIPEPACGGATQASCRSASVPATLLTAPNALAPFLSAGTAIDTVEHTAYAIDYGPNGNGPDILDLINTNRCGAGMVAGCPHQPPTTIPLASFPVGLVIDPSTGTLYVSESGPQSAQLEVIAAATCNISQPTCSDRATVPLTDGGGPVAVDSSTRTVYVGGSSSISVIDARHCYAGDLHGCATQAPAAIPVGSSSSLTTTPNTLYATTIPAFNLPGTVAVIDTRHCNAADTSQCTSITPPMITIGLDPLDVVADPAHDTLYVTDSAFGNSQGALSMIDTSHCQGADTSDCAAHTPLTTPMRRFPYQEVLDQRTNTLYVGNYSNADLSPINTARCNARDKSGCLAQPPEIVVGSQPTALALDADNHTIYVSNSGDGTVSLVATGP